MVRVLGEVQDREHLVALYGADTERDGAPQAFDHDAMAPLNEDPPATHQVDEADRQVEAARRHGGEAVEVGVRSAAQGFVGDGAQPVDLGPMLSRRVRRRGKRPSAFR